MKASRILGSIFVAASLMVSAAAFAQSALSINVQGRHAGFSYTQIQPGVVTSTIYNGFGYTQYPIYANHRHYRHHVDSGAYAPWRGRYVAPVIVPAPAYVQLTPQVVYVQQPRSIYEELAEQCTYRTSRVCRGDVCVECKE